MIFKPLTKSAIKTDELAKRAEQDLGSTALSDIVKTTEERIHIIYDDSGSMSGEAITLAAEGTINFMKFCKPKVTAIEVAPLCADLIQLSKNLPKLAIDIKQVEATGGTPLFRKLGDMVDAHSIKKYTRALIFTDGQASDGPREGLTEQLKGMRIPIDFIIISRSKTVANLTNEEQIIKDVCDASGGQFLIVKDAEDFKQKMKYFAPTLRYMLPSIASEGN